MILDFYQQKSKRICYIYIYDFNETLTNNFVNFEQTAGHRLLVPHINSKE